jgi:hypothetical protein
LPTLLYFQNGEVVNQTIGATSKKNILARLNSPAVTV